MTDPTPARLMSMGNIDPTTTAEDDRRTAGQRRVNLTWETTQAVMAISLTFAEIYCAVFAIDAKALDVAFGAIVTMYFIRTNHTRIGGVGSRDTDHR